MRIYLPATPRDLAATELAAAPAFAVTEALTAEYPDEDIESLEYAAYLAAVDAARDLLRDRPGEVPRRLVIAADVAISSTRAVTIAADVAISSTRAVTIAADVAASPTSAADVAASPAPAATPAASGVQPADPNVDVVVAAPSQPAIIPAAAHPAAIRLPMSSIEWSAVASIHIDEPAAAPDLIDAIGGPPSRPNQTEAAATLAEHDLLWYDPTERPGLIEDLAAGIA